MFGKLYNLLLHTEKYSWISWICIALAVTIARLPTLFAAPIYDEKIYLDFGKRMMEGAVLYIDIWDNKPPIIYYLHEFSYSLFGNTYLPFRILDLILITLSIYYSYYFAVDLFKKYKIYWQTKSFLIISLILTIPFFFDRYLYFNAESLFVTSTIIGLFYYQKFMNDQIKFNRNTSLLLFSIAICTKLIALPEILFLIIGLRWVYNRVSVKKVFVELNIIISPLYLYGLIMFFIGGVNEYLKALGLFIFNYLSDPIDKISSGGLFDVLFVRVAIVLIACIIISINMKSKIYKFLAFWTLVNFLLSTITWKAYPHYLQQLLIPSCILLFGLLIYLTTFQYKSLNLTLLLIKLHIMLYIFVLTCIYPVISTYGIVSYEIQYIRQSWLNDFSFVKNRLEYSLSDIQEYNSLINDDIKNEYFWLLLKNPMDLYYNKQLKLALPFYMPVNSIYQNTSTLLSILRKKEHIFIMLEKEFKVDIPPLIKQVCSLNGQNTKFELYSCKF